ncbi:MAG TPA: YlxR family protein [Pseudonocardiaceae bacterium]|nr:YlxR family protein [Pseudonocardiaceae bacterium]
MTSPVPLCGDPVRWTDRQEIDWFVVHRRQPVPTHLGPIRTCVGCRAATLSTELLRVVVVDGVIVPDPQRRLPGRGAWLHARSECLRAAERRKAFPRALRVPGPLSVGLLQEHLARTLGESFDVGASHVRQEQESRSTRHESAVKLKP